MTTELVTLISLVAVRLAIPLLVTLSLGTWLGRRDERSAGWSA
jgi:hypothetical protein